MNVVVFCGSAMGTDPAYESVARELGAWIGSAGHTLVYGGSNTGLMAVVARATMGVGGAVVGVETSTFVARGVASQRLSRLEVVDTMAQRKHRMMELGDAFVALPGGVGTLDEVTDVACGARVGDPAAMGKPCVMLSVDGYWDPLRQMMRRVVESGFLPDDNPGAAPGSSGELVRFADSVAQVAEMLGGR